MCWLIVKMTLKPLLKSKVDELFLRWVSETDTQQMLKESLRQILHGEPLTTYPVSSGSRSSGKPQSPRIRPSSPPCSPSSKLASPRSPRRPLASKNNHRSHNGNSKVLTNGTKEKDALHRGHDPQLDREKEKEKENKDISIQLNSVSNSGSKNKRKDRTSQRTTVLQHTANLPQFHFPYGRPVASNESDTVLQKVSEEFSKFDGGKVFKHQMAVIAKACNIPLYWKCLLYIAAGANKQGYLTYEMFSSMWKQVMPSCHDLPSRFVKLLAKPNTNYLEEEDFIPLIQDIVDTHPGLTFLQEAPEFHSRYVNTVIARIYYCVNRSWSGRITIAELRKSNFLQVLSLLEEEDDINQISEYFSYEHFYVIYCKFWELDKDHDLFIDKADLSRHNEHAISSRMVDRIFSGAVTRGQTFKDGRMSYPEFVWFLLSEEDKRNPTSVEYWFRCMDLDGDGVLSMYEMEYFYEEQMQKMEALGIERLPFEDALCQMIDLVRPKDPLKITLADLKRCRLTNIFYDTFFNLDKFLEHEQRDPFSNLRDLECEGPEPSDWEKYAAEEYEILVAEEGTNDQEEIHYEDDFEPDDDELGMEEARPSDPVHGTLSPRSHNVTSLRSVDDNIFDYSSSGSSRKGKQYNRQSPT